LILVPETAKMNILIMVRLSPLTAVPMVNLEITFYATKLIIAK